MKKFVMGLLVLLLIAVAVGLIAPKDYSVERRITIEAPMEDVHAWAGELTKWPEWTPWNEDDPSIQTTYGALSTGVGASQAWTSADGDGELTFTKCDPAEGIAYDMVFIVEDTRVPAKAAMTYTSVEGGHTEVVWTIEGSWEGAMPPVLDGWMKILSPWMIGGGFDRGLANLKSKVEAAG